MFVVAHPSESDLENGRILMAQPERELFHQILKALSLSRLDVYVTSLLKCGATLPKEQDWMRCQSHFLNELELVQPEFIISLGYMASIILLGDHVRPGVWGRYQDLDVMPTLHPQDILSGGDGVKRKAWRHLKEVMRRAGLSSHSSTHER
jgi:DNA polymerase